MFFPFIIHTTEIKEDDRERLVISEEDIVINRNEINKGYFKIAKNLFEANQILASYDNTNGKFISWFEGLGLKKTFVYNSIKRYELFLLTHNEDKVNSLSQKAVEMIGSKKVDDSLKIELLKEEGIEKKSDRDLKEYILQIISEHSEMIKKQTNNNIELADEIVSFEKFEKEAGRALELGLVHPAYDYVLKCSHTFNLLDARGAVSVTERAGYIARIRNLARVVAKTFVAERKKLGYPLLDEATRKKLLAEEEE